MGRNRKTKRRIVNRSTINATHTYQQPVVRKPKVFNAALNNAKPNSDTFRNFQNLDKQTTAQVLNNQDVSSIRSQARNEFLNNPHASGIARLFGLYVVGVGPRLKFLGYENIYCARVRNRIKSFAITSSIFGLNTPKKLNLCRR